MNCGRAEALRFLPLSASLPEEKSLLLFFDLIEVDLDGHLPAKEHLNLDGQLAAYRVDIFHHTAEIFQGAGKNPESQFR